MKNSLQIAAIVDRPDQLEDLVKELATRRQDAGYVNEAVPQNWKAVDTSSIETFVSGIVTFDEDNEHVGVSFTTSFLFTCIRGKNENYQIEWGSSLS